MTGYGIRQCCCPEGDPGYGYDSCHHYVLGRINSQGELVWRTWPSGIPCDRYINHISSNSETGAPNSWVGGLYHETDSVVVGTPRIFLFNWAGDELWDVQVSIQRKWGGVDSSGNVVLLDDTTGVVYSYSVADGTVSWSYTVSSSPDFGRLGGQAAYLTFHNNLIQIWGSSEVTSPSDPKFIGIELDKSGAHQRDMSYTGSFTEFNGIGGFQAGAIDSLGPTFLQPTKSVDFVYALNGDQSGAEGVIAKIPTDGSDASTSWEYVASFSLNNLARFNGMAIDSSDNLICAFQGTPGLWKFSSTDGAESDFTVADVDPSSSTRIVSLGANNKGSDPIIARMTHFDDWGTAPGYAQEDKNLAYVTTGDQLPFTASWGLPDFDTYFLGASYSGPHIVCSDYEQGCYVASLTSSPSLWP